MFLGIGRFKTSKLRNGKKDSYPLYYKIKGEKKKRKKDFITCSFFRRPVTHQ